MRRDRVIAVVIGIAIGAGGGVIGVARADLSSQAALAKLNSTPGALVTGAVAEVLTTPGAPQYGIASEAGLAALGTAITQNAQDVGGKLSQGQQTIASAMGKLADGSAVVNGAIAGKTFMAKNVMEAQQDLVVPASHTLMGCKNTLGATAVDNANSQRKVADGQINTALHSHNHGFDSSYASRRANAKMSPAQINMTALIPDGSPDSDVGNGHDDVASGAAAKNLVAYEAAVTAGTPVPTLPKSVAARLAKHKGTGSPKEVEYQSTKNVWDSKMSLAQGALSHIASYYQPVASSKNAWVQSAYKSLGQSPPSGGDESVMSLLDLEVHSRAESSQWFTAIESDNRTGLLREIAQLAAINADINLRRLKTQQLVLALAATRYADHVNKTERPKYMAAYNALAGTKGE
jgi:hypothetical protein